MDSHLCRASGWQTSLTVVLELQPSRGPTVRPYLVIYRRHTRCLRSGARRIQTSPRHILTHVTPSLVHADGAAAAGSSGGAAAAAPSASHPPGGGHVPLVAAVSSDKGTRSYLEDVAVVQEDARPSQRCKTRQVVLVSQHAATGSRAPGRGTAYCQKDDMSLPVYCNGPDGSVSGLAAPVCVCCCLPPV